MAAKEKIGLRGPMPPGMLFAVYDSETGAAEYSGTAICTESCKEKTRTGVIKDFPSEFSLAGT